MAHKKICGVIGGMGPMASLDFARRVIEFTDAEGDSGHMHMLIDNNTSIPDRSAFILEGGESPLPEIIKTVKRLEAAGADFLVMTCNTAHCFADEIEKNADIPFINMIDETGKYLLEKGITNAGLLATTGTVAAGNYEKYLKQYNVEVILPDEDDQELVMKSIYDDIKKAGAHVEKCDISSLTKVIENLKERGATAVILGCTELPLVLNEGNTGILCIDPTAILAKASIKYAGYEIKGE